MPVLRATPDDFVVDEIALYPPAGEGSHTFVHVEKRDATTEGVARAPGRAAEAKSAAMGGLHVGHVTSPGGAAGDPATPHAKAVPARESSARTMFLLF